MLLVLQGQYHFELALRPGTQRILNNIKTLSWWYSLDSSDWVLSDVHLFVLVKSVTSSLDILLTILIWSCDIFEFNSKVELMITFHLTESSVWFRWTFLKIIPPNHPPPPPKWKQYYHENDNNKIVFKVADMAGHLNVCYDLLPMLYFLKYSACFFSHDYSYFLIMTLLTLLVAAGQVPYILCYQFVWHPPGLLNQTG